MTHRHRPHPTHPLPWTTAAIAALPVGILVLTRGGHVVFANPTACALLGRAGPSFVSRRVGEVLAPLAELLSRHAEGDAHLEVTLQSGQRASFAFSLSPLHALGHPREHGHLFLFQDVDRWPDLTDLHALAG